MRKLILLILAAAVLVALRGQILTPIIYGGDPVFPTSNLQYHWTAASFAGTADNAPISSWVDTIHGQAATQGTGANQCHYRTNVTVAGKPSVFCQYLSPASNSVFTQQYFVLPSTVSVTQANTAVFWIGEYGDPYPYTYPTVINFGTGAYNAGWTFFMPAPPGTGAIPGGPAWSGANQFNNVTGSLALPVGPYGVLMGTKTTGPSVVAEGITGTRSLTLSGSTTITGGYIGAWTGTQASFGYTDQAIYEIFVYSAYPSAAQIAQLQAYANTKYGAPVGARTRNIICAGDSITAGLGSNTLQSWPYKMARNGNHWQTAAIRNLGVSGMSAVTTVGSETKEFPPEYSSAYTKNIAVLWLGTNDIAIAGQTDSQTISSIKTLGIYVKSLGFKVVWVTILPRAGMSSTQNTYITNVNAYIQGTNGSVIEDGAADAIADLTLNSHLYPLANYLAGYTIDGGTHPNDAGYSIIAPLIYSAVSSLF